MGSSVRHGRRRGSAGVRMDTQADTIFKLALNAPDDPESFHLPFHVRQQRQKGAFSPTLHSLHVTTCTCE